MHVAFIALSGIRVRNERLLELGLTLPGFVERSRVIASMPSLSPLTLAGMTPDRFEVSYHEVDDVRKLGALPACDLAAISTYSQRSSTRVRRSVPGHGASSPRRAVARRRAPPPGGGAASTELTPFPVEMHRRLGLELSHDAAFAGRVRRLALVSALALGALTGLWWADISGSAVLGALLTSGWVTMPLLLAASLSRPLLRYGLVAPVLLVGAPVAAAAIGEEGVAGTARVGWILVAAGIALGAFLGLWFWYRLLPVPERLDDPFSRGRLVLIAVHVAAVTAGIAAIFEASVS